MDGLWATKSEGFAPTGVGSGEGVSPSPVVVGSGAPENFFDFVLRNVELLCILDSGDSTATVIATMMFMTLAHQCCIDRLVLPAKYRPRPLHHYVVKCRLKSLLRYQLTLTDCYPHCSVFTVHNFTKTLVGCGVSS